MARSPRILMVYRADDRDADEVFTRIAPYGLFTIHGYLRAHGFDSRLYNLTGRSFEEIGRLFAELRPDVIGVSHFTFNHAASTGLYRVAAEVVPRALRVAGGPQATHLDVPVLRRRPGPDVIVRGEGEDAMLALVRRVADAPAGVALATLDFSSVPNLSWSEGGEIRRTDEARPPDDIDPFHTPERYDENHGVRAAEQYPIVITSRGCPATCTFCNTPFYWGRAMRFRSARSVADEFDLVRRRWGTSFFSIRDDTFTASRGRVREICDELLARRIHVLWNCQSRVNLVDEERLLWMKKAGCDQLQFGVESASEHILADLAKKIRVDQIENALRLCRAAGIKTSAYFIVGVPGQEDADLEANRRLFETAGLMEGIVSSLAYYPGTELFDDAKARGEVDEEIFFTGEVEPLYVRHDPHARKQFDTMLAAIAREAPRRGFTREEIETHLAATGRCWSALLDLGAWHEAHGDRAAARAAYVETIERWPDSPWGYAAMAALERRSGRRRQAREYAQAGRRRAHGEPPPEPQTVPGAAPPA